MRNGKDARCFNLVPARKETKEARQREGGLVLGQKLNLPV